MSAAAVFACAAVVLACIMQRRFLFWVAARAIAVGTIAITFPPSGQLLFASASDAILLRTIATDIALALIGPLLATYIDDRFDLRRTRILLWSMLPIGVSLTVLAPSIAFADKLDMLHDIVLAGLIVMLVVALVSSVRAGSRAAMFQSAAWLPGICVAFAALFWELALHRAAPFYFEAILIAFLIEFVVTAAGIGDGYMIILRQRDAAMADVRTANMASSLDPLTGIANRRGLARRFRDPDAGRPAGIAMVDCDLFKRVNDSHGHDIGDEVLVAVARALSTENCFPGRLGGEEFMLLLYGPQWERTAEMARRRITGSVRENVPELSFPVTASAGLAAIDAEDSMESAMKRADRALYAAKGAGRDRSLRLTDFPALEQFRHSA